MNKTVFEKKLDERTNRARLAGAMYNYTLDIGLNKYEKSILPIETMEDYPSQAAGCETIPEPPYAGNNIIPFPGISLEYGFDNLLRDLGYID